MSGWDDVAAWFRSLLVDRDDLGPELLVQVDRWLAHDADRDTTIATLFEHVANDVRYTGLEFGLVGYQPYACN
ncbi:MAG: hypothetical protein J6386_17660 [Candidatus Synoicihabitans palmerolidicus]|nr:hypothetical protein [Candidatus Synoicihabitans palmerolidicus]